MAELSHQPITASFNLCERSREERDYAAAKTLAHFWLHQKRNKQMTRLDIQKRLNAMTDKQRELHRRALNDAQAERKRNVNA